MKTQKWHSGDLNSREPNDGGPLELGHSVPIDTILIQHETSLAQVEDKLSNPSLYKVDLKTKIVEAAYLDLAQILFPRPCFPRLHVQPPLLVVEAHSNGGTPKCRIHHEK
jgi:hypothetical protein